MRWRNKKDEDGAAVLEGQSADAAASAASDEAVDTAATSGDDAARPARPEVPVMLGAVGPEELARAVRRAVTKALTEDLGGRGDVTSSTTVPADARGRAELVAREPGVVAVLAVVGEVCAQVDHRIEVDLRVADGDKVAAGDVVAELRGPLRTLLTAERTLLNLLCQLSGVATTTAAFAAALEGTDCVVRDTRKTTPGLRLLEKAAVAAGGGANHRIGLFDAILVKDNHVAAAGGVGAASRAALAGAPEGVHVQVEVTSVEEAEEAIEAGVTDLLLDNFSPDALRAAVDAIGGRAAVEASGGITLETARAYALAGADRVAVGALTHSAPALDLALDVVEVTRGAAPAAAPVGEPADETADEAVEAEDGADDSVEDVVASTVDDAATDASDEEPDDAASVDDSDESDATDDDED